MIERLFSAVLTFALLAGGTYAVGSELFGGPRQLAAAHRQAVAVELPRVEITGRRHAALVATSAQAGSAATVCLQ